MLRETETYVTRFEWLIGLYDFSDSIDLNGSIDLNDSNDLNGFEKNVTWFIWSPSHMTDLWQQQSQDESKVNHWPRNNTDEGPSLE